MKLAIVAATLAVSFAVLPMSEHHAQAEDESPTRQVDLKTVFLSTPLEGAHQIHVSGVFGGAGTLQLDPNKCGLNDFGDVTFCTRMATRSVQIRIQPVKVADPAGRDRKMYELVGKGIGNRLYLVVPSGSESGYRLVSKNRTGIERVVTLETTVVAAADGNKPAGGVEAKVGVPQGAQKGAAEYHAIQVPGWVVVTAVGDAPTPGHKVHLWQLPLEIFPPQFELLWVPPTDPVIQVLHPFRISTRFHADKRVDSVIVHDRDGQHEVKVEQLPDSADQNVKAAAPEEKNESTAGKQESKARFLPCGHVQVVTGTSNEVSLDKAIEDAIGKLVAPFPDAQFQFKVLEIGGTHGGIAGMSSLSVTVMGSIGK